MRAVVARFFSPAILILLAVSFASPHRLSAQQERTGTGIPLSKLLNSDGTLSPPHGFAGSIDPSGWSITLGSDGRPHFVPSASPGSGAGIAADTADVHWDNRFIGPSGVDQRVNAIAVIGNDIFFGGAFQGSEKVLASNIVKWNTASGVWSPLGTGTNSVVYALAVMDSNLYVGGDFTQAGGLPANHVARWNNAGWSSLGTSPNDGVNNRVYALTVSGTNLFVGGTFTTAGSGTTVNRVARWDGSSWSALGTGVGGAVYALCVSGSDLFAGGTFTTAGGNTASNIARWTGSAWVSLGTSPNEGVAGTVRALAGGTPYLYVGGDFDGSRSGVLAIAIIRWNGSIWSALGNGFTTSSVRSILVDGPSVYAAGSFTASGIISVSRIARWDTASSTWSALNQGADTTIYCMLKNGTTLYVGGDFTSVSNTGSPIPANHIARWTGSLWSDLGSSVSNSINGPGVAAIAISGSDIYLGGLFKSVDGITANNVAKYNGNSNTWSSLGSGAENGVRGVVSALAVAANGSVYVGGQFGQAGSIPANNIALWNGSSWSTLGTSPNDGVDNSVDAILISGSNVFVSGGFATAGGISASRIARWNGSAWSTLGTGMNDRVRALEVIGSDLFAGGRFTSAGGTPVHLVARWNGTDWLPVGTPPNDGVRGFEVNALARIGTTLYVGGNIDSAAGATIPVNHIAKWDGSAWSALGNGVNGSVGRLAVSGGSLYVAGAFNATGIINASAIARWDTGAGGTWTNLGSGITPLNEGSQVLALAVSGNDVYAGGTFIQAGAKPSCKFAHWNPSLVTSGVSSRPVQPAEFALAQNFPNPFNPATAISFQLSAGSVATLKVYDILGREVATLVEGYQSPGNHTVRFDASRFSSGVYFYRLAAGDFLQTKKMVLLK